MTLESKIPERTMAAEVSSHDDSMPRIVMSIIIYVNFITFAYCVLLYTREYCITKV